MAIALQKQDSLSLLPGSPAKAGGGGGGVAVKKDDGFVLGRQRVEKQARTFDDSPWEITDNGLHWNEEGKAIDVTLVTKIADLFKALINEFNPDLNPNLSTKEKEWILAAVREFEFWEDSKKFLEVMVKDDLEERKLLSYRKMSFLVEEWLNRSQSRSSRQSTLNDMENIIKDRAKADARVSKAAAALKLQHQQEGEVEGAPPSPSPPPNGHSPQLSLATSLSSSSSSSLSLSSPTASGPLSPTRNVNDMASLPPHLRRLQKEGSTKVSTQPEIE